VAQGRRDRIALRPEINADGSTTLYARFSVPEKQADGKIVWRRTERSTRTSDPKKAVKVAERVREDAYKLAYSDAPVRKKERTFAEAALAYLRAGGSGQYLPPILKAIGNVSLSEITSEFVYELADELYSGRKPATQNRHLFTPIIAVLRSAESKDYNPPRIARPKGWLPKSNFKRPPKDWWARVLDECEPSLAAFVLFVRLHGRRTSEACRITPADIDSDTWNVRVTDTKTDQEIVFQLSEPVIEQLKRYPWRFNKYVFGLSSKSKVYPKLKAACARAGVPYHVPKDAGRHSFATYMLEQGKTLAEVKEGGRWASTRMPDLIYGHLEQKRVDEDVRNLGERWVKEMGEKGDVVSLPLGGRAGDKNR
jgi:integrase